MPLDNGMSSRRPVTGKLETAGIARYGRGYAARKNLDTRRV